MSHEKPLGPIAIVLLGAILLCGPILPLLNPLNLFLSVSYAVPGALLAIRRPRNVIGWLLVMIGRISLHVDLADVRPGDAGVGPRCTV